MANPYDIESIAEEIKGYWGQRKLALLKLWDFYYGHNQRYYFNRFEGEDQSEYDERVASAAIENHCAKTCDVLVSYLYGQPESESRVNVKVIDKDGNIVSGAQRLLQDNIWVVNDIDSFRIDVALMASVTGCGIVYKEFVDKRTMLPFPRNVSKEEKKKYGTIRYELYDTVDTLPLPLVDSGSVIHSRILGAIVRYYSQDNFSGISLLDRIMQKRFSQQEILEVFDSNRRIRAVQLENGELSIVVNENNPYGNVNTIFTLFKNYGDPMFLEGLSDLGQMLDLQVSLNELFNDDRTTIGYHSFPILVLTGGGKLPPNFIRKVNSAFELDTNQDAKYLTWDNVLEASANAQNSIRKQMTVTSGVGQLSRGNAEDVGQIRSGAGLKTLFQADINAIALKVPNFKRAERELAQSTLQMWEMETGESFGDNLRIQVDFPEDFMGLDELLKAQTRQIELASFYKTIRETIKKTHPDVASEEEVDAIFEQIVEEQEELAEAKAGPQMEVAEMQSETQKEIATKKGETSEEKSQQQQK